MTFVLNVGMLIVAVVVAILAAKQRDRLPFALSLVGALTLAVVLLVRLIATEPVMPKKILSSKLAERPGAQTVGKAAYGDWRSDAPGLRRYIRSSDLPAPYDLAPQQLMRWLFRNQVMRD